MVPHELPFRASPPRSPSNPRIESAWSGAFAATAWTPPLVRGALDALECGHLEAAARLGDSIERDCVVLDCIDARVRAFASRSALPFSVERSDEGDGRKVEAIRQRIAQLWWETCSEFALAPIMRDVVKLNVGLGRIWWDRTPHEWVPYLSHLPLHGLEYSEAEKRWYYHTSDGQRLHVTPGDGTWFLHLPNGPRSYMHGAIRAVAEPWLARRYASRDENRWLAAAGMASLKVHEPYSAQDNLTGNDGSGSVASSVYRDLRAGLTGGAVIRLPQAASKDEPGWDADWLELKGTSFEAFSKSLERNKADIQEAILGRSSSGSKGGDGELMSEMLRNERLASDTEPLSTSLREQVWKPYVAFNHGREFMSATPWGRWNTVPPVNRKTRAETVKTLSEALPSLITMGVNVAPLLEEFGLEAPNGVQAPPPPPPPATEPTKDTQDTQ